MTIDWEHIDILLHFVWAIVTGIAAGIVFFIGYYRKERKQMEAMRRVERFVEWTMMITLNIVEVHNEFHPEAKVDTRSLSKLLHDATSRTWEDED